MLYLETLKSLADCWKQTISTVNINCTSKQTGRRSSKMRVNIVVLLPVLSWAFLPKISVFFFKPMTESLRTAVTWSSWQKTMITISEQKGLGESALMWLSWLLCQFCNPFLKWEPFRCRDGRGYDTWSARWKVPPFCISHELLNKLSHAREEKGKLFLWVCRLAGRSAEGRFPMLLVSLYVCRHGAESSRNSSEWFFN